ncbi:Myotubularin-related protein 13 [Nymphon striatum]|nr:Myotubularin-related protein 13 [Nymphon striatum]
MNWVITTTSSSSSSSSTPGSGLSFGKILQRFPEKDWNDTPFIEGIELFCQPQGWNLSTERQHPTFFVSVLTDIDANRHYCACLSFNEAIAITPSKQPDEEDMDIEAEAVNVIRPNNSTAVQSVNSTVHHSIMYAPKCLVLVSSLDYFSTFRNCLGVIYSVYVENMPVSMETLVGNILGCVQVPPAGGPQVRFSIGAGDRQALQPPLSNSLPCTNISVATLFQQLGIRNVITIFCAALTEHKILFHSQSYSRLTDGCHALTSLLYPLRYSHVYIPLLPAALIEVLNTPTPFIMGVHASLKNDVADLMDVVIADLDGGSIFIPECITLSLLPDPLYTHMHNALCMVLRPELISADYAFPPSETKTSPLVMLDKEIRAIFLRSFAQLLQGYRSCLNIVRIHPKPFITFHKAAFLGKRNMVDDDFMSKVLDCMFFNTFVAERGPPYRVCDTFDELYANMQEILKTEVNDTKQMMTNIQELAHQFYMNENPNPQPYVQKIPKPTEGAFTRIHQPTFPKINHAKVQDIINEGMTKYNLKARLQAMRPQQTRIVPVGPSIVALGDNKIVVGNSARRLEVLRNCINCIFDNKISDARKTFPAVLRALKNKSARLALTQELSFHVIGNKAMLDNQQFDLIVRLMNCALQDDSVMDEHGLAAALLPLATAFCRKLCTGVIQFAYTCVQDHSVWSNQQFWESTFFQDVQKDIKALYCPKTDKYSRTSPEILLFQFNHRDSIWTYKERTMSDIYQSRRLNIYMKPQEPSALEIAAEQMRLWNSVSSEKQLEMINNEESTVYSQAIHFTNRMVALRVPIDINKSVKSTHSLEGESNSTSNLTNSVEESDSFDAESGFEEESTDAGAVSVVRFVSRFVDKVCVVAMQIETLEAVHRESKRLPPTQKPKILMPSLLPGEVLVTESLRVYLIPDGREEGIGGVAGGPVFLPAEGAIFLTNYRVIFKGIPCDSFVSENIVIRYFPISSLTKEKKVNVQYPAHLDQWFQEGLQLRSNTFQLTRIAFDEEVTSENIETFRKFVNRVCHPPSVYDLFAFTGTHVAVQQTPLHKQKEKNATLRVLAKKTLLKTARKAGFKPKPSSRKQKYVLQGGLDNHYGKSMTIASGVGRSPDSEAMSESRERPLSMMFEDDSPDYIRIGLVSNNVPSASGNNSKSGKSDAFKITSVNLHYSVCHSYPALVVVPQSVSDDSIKKFSKCHRHCRFPVITWQHHRTKALLLRASGMHSKGVIGMLKSHPSNKPTKPNKPSVSNELSARLEQEKYIAAVVNSTPISYMHPRASAFSAMSDSTLSINSLVLTAGSNDAFPSMTPEFGRRTNNPFHKAMNSLRASGGKNTRQFSRWGSLKDKRHGSQSSLGSEMGYGNATTYRGISRHEGSDVDIPAVHALPRAAFYIFGEKGQMKSIKSDAFPKCDFIPVEFYEVREVKASFKKLMRACAPSSVISDPEQTFHKCIENSEWLHQIQSVLQLSGAVVDLMDVQGSSVMVSLEDGWDVSTQVVSIAQIMLDPYYRTLSGFKTLIEKEWVSFGHRFTHRCNHTTSTQASGFAPIFLQFLDVVHQIHSQFPMSFEFNQYFLKFIAYHYVSCRFRTFMLDSECDRVEMGWITDERSPSGRHRGLDSGSEDDSPTGLSSVIKMSTSSSANATGNFGLSASIWEYIDRANLKSPVFYNCSYSPNNIDTVLRPYSNISNLQIWDYYLMEDLAHGPSFDFELVAMEMQKEEETAAVMNDSMSSKKKPSNRKVVNSCYDNIGLCQPDVFTSLLEEIHNLESELGHLPQKWQVLWDKLEPPSTDTIMRQSSFTTQMIRLHGRSIHKRGTIEILVRGKLVGEMAQVYSHPHRFEKYNYTTPTYCDFCSNILWGLVKTGMRCVDCGYNCHEKCLDSVPKNCTKYKSVPGDSSTISANTSNSVADNSSVSSSVTTMQTSQYYDQFSANVAENRTHEGYLFKRGALLKGWKQRWFVLDSIKHQLRYYDATDDSHCKGYIDLAEVVSVAPAASVQGPPKRVDDKAFFDLKTVRRVYNFMASDGPSAHEWVEKIQSCL